MTTKIPVELSSTPGIVDGSNATAITIDSSENVGIGTTSIDTKLHVEETTANTACAVTVESNNWNSALILKNGNGTWEIVNDYTGLGTDAALGFFSGGAHRMLIDSAGKVGIGTTAPDDYYSDNLVVSAPTEGGITIASTNTSNGNYLAWADGTSGDARYRGIVGYNHAGDYMFMSAAGAERMRLKSSEIQFFKSDSASATVGVYIQDNGRYIGTTNSNLEPMILNRQHSDGTLIEFRHANSTEGTISVSGSTVSYNGFSGRHETSGIANNIAVGTVVSTIDALDTYSDTGEDREDHAKVKVSDTVGDTRIYGVLAEYADKTNKPMIASVGIGSVKVTGACSGGDLLESNGDGTAKVQSDDIVRSKTIGKVTIGNSETGVKLVSCVLYCG